VQPIRDAEVLEVERFWHIGRQGLAIRMPSDTIMPVTAMGGRFKNPAVAYEQRDVMIGDVLACWAACQKACAAWTWTT
jgi:hypothetical protein